MAQKCSTFEQNVWYLATSTKSKIVIFWEFHRLKTLTSTRAETLLVTKIALLSSVEKFSKNTIFLNFNKSCFFKIFCDFWKKMKKMKKNCFGKIIPPTSMFSLDTIIDVFLSFFVIFCFYEGDMRFRHTKLKICFASTIQTIN